MAGPALNPSRRESWFRRNRKETGRAGASSNNEGAVSSAPPARPGGLDKCRRRPGHGGYSQTVEFAQALNSARRAGQTQGCVAANRPRTRLEWRHAGRTTMKLIRDHRAGSCFGDCDWRAGADLSVKSDPVRAVVRARWRRRPDGAHPRRSSVQAAGPADGGDREQQRRRRDARGRPRCEGYPDGYKPPWTTPLPGPPTPYLMPKLPYDLFFPPR